MAKMIHFMMSGCFLEEHLIIINSCANTTNSIAKVTNSIAKGTNSFAKMTNSIAKATNPITKTCNITGYHSVIVFDNRYISIGLLLTHPLVFNYSI